MYEKSVYIRNMVKDTKIPEFVRVHQSFERPVVVDIPQTIAQELEAAGVAKKVHKGDRIALTAGSRGVANMPLILREVGHFLRNCGAEPFIVPAMGSHGGATAQGQRQIIEGYGITEAFCKMPIRSSMKVVQVGTTDAGDPVYLDKFSHEADGIIPIGRIKAHTDFRGPYESGIMKMMVIGLGKQFGAQAFHSHGCARYAELLPEYGKTILRNENVLVGIGLIENAYDETAQIAVLSPEQIVTEEPKLLVRAKELMGCLQFHNIDLLIVDRIGKEISGEGMDPNVTGRFATPYASGGSDAKTVCVLDITENSHGAFVGIGMADMTTMRLFRKADFEKSYINQLTSTMFLPSKMPIVLENDKIVIQACLKYCGENDKENPRVIRIRDTMHLENIMISTSMLPDALANPRISVCSDPFPLVFNAEENLF